MMKRLGWVGLVAALGCTSVQRATISDREVISAADADEGKPIVLVQVDTLGLSLFMHAVPLVAADLDTVVNQRLLGEAKAMGGTRVEIQEAWSTPTGGVFALTNCMLPIPLILCFRQAHATAIVLQ